MADFVFPGLEATIQVTGRTDGVRSDTPFILAALRHLPGVPGHPFRSVMSFSPTPGRRNGRTAVPRRSHCLVAGSGHL